MTHWAQINIFPDEVIALNREIVNHPKLQIRLANHPAHEWEIKLAEIAHYCDMILHGDYLPEDMVKISAILTRKLIAKREYNGGLVIIESGGFDGDKYIVEEAKFFKPKESGNGNET